MTTELPEKPLLCCSSYSVPNVRGSVLGGHAVEYARVSNTVRKPEFFILARIVSALKLLICEREIGNILPLHQITPVECIFIPCQTGASQRDASRREELSGLSYRVSLLAFLGPWEHRVVQPGATWFRFLLTV